MDLAEHLGVTSAQAQRQLDSVANRVRKMGRTFNPPTRLFNTGKAHRLAEYARDRGKMDPLRTALFRAYWVDGRNLAATDVLGDLAAQVGLDPAEALAGAAAAKYGARLAAAATAARQHQVRGVPAFVVAPGKAMSGAQPYPLLVEMIRQAGG